EETISLLPLSNQNNEREVNNLIEPFDKPSNKRSKNYKTGNSVKKLKTLDKTDKLKSWYEN
ncbi:1507_t:CDS:1, partial [Funneliformis caledonium]